MQAPLVDLTDAQLERFTEIRAEALRDGTPVRDLIPVLVESKRDQAAIAEAFAPGAGKDYL